MTKSYSTNFHIIYRKFAYENIVKLRYGSQLKNFLQLNEFESV